MLTKGRVISFVGVSAFIGAAAFACSSGSGGFGDDGGGAGSTGSTAVTYTSNGTVYTSYASNTSGSTSTTNYNTSNTNTNTNTSNTSQTTNTSPTSTSTAASGAGCGTPVLACSATKASGAVALSSCFYTGTGSAGGYAYYFGDTMSTSCVNSDSLCGSGNVVMADSAYKYYGSGFGISLDQTSGGGDAGAYTSTASGLTWAVSGSAPSFQISVVAASGPCATAAGCCYRPTGTSGTIPWGSFTTTCYNPGEAGAGFAASAGLLKINFQTSSNMTGAQTFNYCLTTLTY